MVQRDELLNKSSGLQDCRSSATLSARYIPAHWLPLFAEHHIIAGSCHDARGSWSAGATIVGGTHLLPKSRGEIVTVAPSRQQLYVCFCIFSSFNLIIFRSSCSIPCWNTVSENTSLALQVQARSIPWPISAHRPKMWLHKILIGRLLIVTHMQSDGTISLRTAKGTE